MLGIFYSLLTLSSLCITLFRYQVKSLACNRLGSLVAGTYVICKHDLIFGHSNTLLEDYRFFRRNFFLANHFFLIYYELRTPSVEMACLLGIQNEIKSYRKRVHIYLNYNWKTFLKSTKPIVSCITKTNRMLLSVLFPISLYK